MYHTEKATPTFTTRNRSRKKFYTLVLAGMFVGLMATIILLYRRDRINQMYRDIETGPRGKLSGNGRSTHSKRPGVDGDRIVFKPEEKFYASESIESEIVTMVPFHGGPLKGQVLRRNDQRNVLAFLGVPYAQPPINEFRFEPPKLVSNWTEIRDAFFQPPRCAQSTTISTINELHLAKHVRMSEDCLYLNIWTPMRPTKAASPGRSNPPLRPVLVFFHGGLFEFGAIGSPDLDGSNLTAMHDVVTITVQYRLGAQGFVAFPSDLEKDDFLSFGLQDQLKALEWIEKNIKAFGGDAKQITLAGHGAGAVSLGLHLTSSTIKSSRRVIVQGIDNIWNRALYSLAPKSSGFFLDDLGCDLKNIDRDHLKKCVLKLKINMAAILETQQFQIDKFPIPFGPQINPFTRQVAKMLEGDAAVDLTQLFGKWKVFPENIDYLIGLNSDDDYQLDKINKHTGQVSFDDQDEEEEEEEEEEVKEESQESPSSSSTTESPNSEPKSEKEEEETEEGSEEISKKDVEVSEEKMKTNQTTSVNHLDDKKSENLKLENDDDEDDAEDDETDDESATSDSTTNSTAKAKRETVAPTISSDDYVDEGLPVGMVVRRRRKRRQISTTTTFKFEPQETIKFCRLVMMWRLQRQDAQVSASKVFLYRIEPKVLLNPLEEVSMAFGARQNWLDSFSSNLRKLWASFIVSGNLNSLDAKLASYDSKLNDLGSDTVNLIQFGQDSSEKMGTIAIVPVSVKSTCEGVTW